MQFHQWLGPAVAVVCAAALVACDRAPANSGAGGAEPETTTGVNEPQNENSPTPAAHSPAGGGVKAETEQGSTVGRADRKQYDQGLAAGDRGTTAEDVALVQNIRRMLYTSDQFTRSGDKISIIARNGNVTLQGTVNSDEEARAFESTVRRTTGVTSVDNQLKASK